MGFLIAFCATPRMTAGHLLFAFATTGYILIATQLEERDLIAHSGDACRDYRRRVPGFMTLPRRRAAADPATAHRESGSRTTTTVGLDRDLAAAIQPLIS